MQPTNTFVNNLTDALDNMAAAVFELAVNSIPSEEVIEDTRTPEQVQADAVRTAELIDTKKTKKGPSNAHEVITRTDIV